MSVDFEHRVDARMWDVDAVQSRWICMRFANAPRCVPVSSITPVEILIIIFMSRLPIGTVLDHSPAWRPVQDSARRRFPYGSSRSWSLDRCRNNLSQVSLHHNLFRFAIIVPRSSRRHASAFVDDSLHRVTAPGVVSSWALLRIHAVMSIVERLVK